MPSLRARWTKMCLEMMCLKTVCLVVAVAFLAPTLLPAQGTGGRILGRVSDPSGAVIAHVKVVVTNEATGVSRDAESNDSGDYSFPRFPLAFTLSASS